MTFFGFKKRFTNFIDIFEILMRFIKCNGINLKFTQI